MKQIDKNAYQEKRYGRGHLILVAVIVAVISLAMLIGGVALFVHGCIVDGVWSTIWRIVLGVIMVLFGGSFGWVAIMMFATASAMIKVKDGNVSDVGNSAMGTVNVVKCTKCGQKLDNNATFCTKCGTQVEGVVKCECGTVNSTDNEYCKSCGKKLK
ncbi:MAG: zinc-ribbon domain-containing protein [Clostridia bacterium]|nr:zinc-ribbon domain-containing protein [Clostridia bacterium]